METIKILPVDLEEVDELRKISEQTFLDTYAIHNTQENLDAHLLSTYNVELLRREIQEGICEYYFAKIGNEVVGYLRLNLAPHQTDVNDPLSIEIERIYILKEYQGKRIGHQLIDFTKSRANKKYKYVWLGVWEKNPKAILFYEKMGFVKFDIHTFKLGDDLQTDFLMKIELQ